MERKPDEALLDAVVLVQGRGFAGGRCESLCGSRLSREVGGLCRHGARLPGAIAGLGRRYLGQSEACAHGSAAGKSLYGMGAG